MSDWIRCSEQLPQDAGIFEVTYEEKGSALERMRFTWIATFGPIEGWHSISSLHPKLNVIAWRPISEPYQGEP